MQIAILGLGNMGCSIVSGLNKANLRSWIFDRNEAKRETVLSQNLTCEFADSYKSFIDGLLNCELFFLCIRTEQLIDFFESLNTEIDTPTIVLFQAGLRLSDLSISDKKKPGILRVITNINVKSKNGYTVILKNEVNRDFIKLRKLFSDLGIVLEVETEAELELYSLLPGCGPALILNLCDSLRRKAVEMGIKESIASEMITSLVVGSVRTKLESEMTLADLAKMVGTKGGEVEKAILKMQKNRVFDKVVSEYFDKIQGIK